MSPTERRRRLRLNRQQIINALFSFRKRRRSGGPWPINQPREDWKFRGSRLSTKAPQGSVHRQVDEVASISRRVHDGSPWSFDMGCLVRKCTSLQSNLMCKGGRTQQRWECAMAAQNLRTFPSDADRTYLFTMALLGSLSFGLGRMDVSLD